MTDRTCTIEGCERNYWARGMCTNHYQAWRKHGDPLISHKAKRKTCRIEGCDKKAHGHSLCTKHYLRWHKHGDPLALLPRYDVCQMDDCDRTPRSELVGLCEMHYYRRRRHGDPSVVKDTSIAEPTYRSAHSRVTRAKGRAADYPCVDCGRAAHHWSYDHQDDSQLWTDDAGGRHYSADPNHYEPRCARCHRLFDAA